MLWLSMFTSSMTLTLDFQGEILKLLYLRMGGSSIGMKGMWVGYDVGCTMGLTLGHGAWQIDWPSNGSMWNSYSFQPVGQWMGYSFTDQGAEGCCCSLNALLIHQWLWNDAQSLKQQRRGALLFFKAIRQFSRSRGTKNHQFWPKLSVSGL